MNFASFAERVLPLETHQMAHIENLPWRRTRGNCLLSKHLSESRQESFLLEPVARFPGLPDGHESPLAFVPRTTGLQEQPPGGSFSIPTFTRKPTKAS